MKIDDKLLDKLEKLSHLRVSEDKKEAIKSELSDIVGFVENLNELDTSNTEATFSPIEDGAKLRDDIIKKDTTTNKIILDNTQSKDNFFIVPNIIE
jgi:aspartyl-tRNA(Asn)/glutamyl-tRNA(Gln) amidotransferase subunit C